MVTDNPDDTSEFADAPELDRAEIERDIAAGAKAYTKLLDNAELDWGYWYQTILGLRGLRSLAYAKARTTNMQSQSFRDAMSSLLQLRKYAIYDRMKKQTRGDCYRLMDRLEDVDRWYRTEVDIDDKMRWKHPGTIAKHCPKEYLSSIRAHNKPPPQRAAAKKPPMVNFETERLKALLIQVIKQLAKYEPDALKLLDQLYPADPDDGVADLFAARDDDD